jgi:ABC-2 type transport system ATP-binding protein|tara:strand:- start:24819 stop:25514 length:696 start_codon:yes stop_codon:yes gene_type:complete
MIKIENLTKTYSGDQVLNISSLGISKGSCFGLVGNNGAGKTTLFSLLLDLIEPTSGEILNQGIEVSKDESWKEKTSAFIDSTFIISYLTPEEYFEFIAELRGVNKEALKSWLEKFSDFFKDEVLSQKKYIRDLSKGNQKKVGIASSLIGSPELVILDEPFSNLDPSSQILLKKLIQNLSKNNKTTFLISSHDLSHVTEVCNRIVLLEKGKIIKDIETNKETLKQLEDYFTL